MKHREDARIDELKNLRLALATFVLHLDRFRDAGRTEGFLTASKPGEACPRTEGGRNSRKDKMIGGQ